MTRPFATVAAANVDEASESIKTHWLKLSLTHYMLDASCDVLMSQSLLRSFGDSVMKTLAKRARDAEEKGFDIEQPCLEGVAEACEYFDDVLLYSRLKQDAYALRQARQSSLNFEPLE